MLLVLGIMSMFKAVPARAQDDSAPPQAAQQPESAAPQEADEESALRESPSVRAVGKVFGLSPHASSEVFEVLNFALLGGVLVFYLIKFVPKLLRARQEKIDAQLVEAHTATEQANARLKAVEDRLGRLDREIEELRKRAEEEGKGDEQRIKQAIEEERKRIVAATEQEIAIASAVAERSLRKFAAELAVDRAMGRLQLTETQDRALVHDFAAGLEGAELQERRN
jgi:F-type H+-transporting ATPase subunit b